MRNRDFDIRKRPAAFSGSNLDLRIWVHPARDRNDCVAPAPLDAPSGLAHAERAIDESTTTIA